MKRKRFYIVGSIVLLLLVSLFLILKLPIEYKNKDLQKSDYEETFIFDKFEKEYGIEISLSKEDNVGIAKINLVDSVIDTFSEEKKMDFRYDFLASSFIELSEKIEADNYKIVYTHSTDQYIFNYNYVSSKENIEDNLKGELMKIGDFYKNIDSFVI